MKTTRGLRRISTTSSSRASGSIPLATVIASSTPGEPEGIILPTELIERRSVRDLRIH